MLNFEVFLHTLDGEIIESHLFEDLCSCEDWLSCRLTSGTYGEIFQDGEPLKEIAL